MDKELKLFGKALENINCGDVVVYNPHNGNVRKATINDIEKQVSVTVGPIGTPDETL